MTGPNPHRSGTPEAAEWDEIAFAPAWHSRSIGMRRTMLAAVADGAATSPGTPHTVRVAAEHAEQLAAAGVLFGPDVSQYQGKPAWSTVRAAGCRFAWRKATEGRTFVDPSGDYNQAGIRAAGLLGGAYHFLYYSDEYANNPALWGAQAEHFARHVDPGEGHCLDVEAAATAGHWLGVREWVAEYRRLFPGHPLGGYFNRSLWFNRSRMPYSAAGLFDFCWHAGIGDGYYTAATGTIPAEWAAIKSLTNSAAGMGYPEVRLWQVTDHAQVAGIAGTCDGNAFQGDAAELAAVLTGNGQVDDSMSTEDVNKLLARIDRLPAEIAAAVGGRTSYNDKDPYRPETPLTFDRMLNEMFRRSDDAGTLTPAAQTAIGAALAPLVKTLVVDALTSERDPLAERLAARLAAGIDVAGVDYDRMRALLGEGLTEHIGTLRITSVPPADGA